MLTNEDQRKQRDLTVHQIDDRTLYNLVEFNLTFTCRHADGGADVVIPVLFCE